jgi:glycosyltransferase involved in cell wall biosynthesis
VKIAFLHYHLRTGGVTTVLRHQIEALQDDADLLLITGDTPPKNWPCRTVCVPGVGYSMNGDRPGRADQIADQILKSITHHFGSACDLLHIHNPLLAKNHLFLDIIHLLQQSGATLFLQIHDFAEDGRPAACYPDVPYPANCHFGVINRRDYRYLLRAGLLPEGVHYLPNCVVPFDTGPAPRPEASFILYPVRAIRRKNIGEALLLSLFLRHDQSVYITQPPHSPVDFPSYLDWKTFTKAHRLPVRFDVGVRRRFQSLMAAADGVLTTSITEGFGFAFLEPWTAGKPLQGRLLEDVCQDFIDQGMDFGNLYTAIQIPQAWIGKRPLIDRFAACLGANQSAYGRLWPEGWTTSCLQYLHQSENIDFGLLDELFQKRIIAMVQKKPALRGALLAMNPDLAGGSHPTDANGRVLRNRERVLALYHPGRYRVRLMETYRRVLQKPVRHALDRKRLLAQFLQKDRFSLLKWDAYHGR